MPIGTARLAHFGLPGSRLRVGVDFSDDPVVKAAIAEEPPPYVLFPGEGARDVRELPRDRPISLIVLDGTWTQAKKLLRLNPALAALPRVAFSPSEPSRYQIRKQPAPLCVSTIEALLEVLRVLEPPSTDLSHLLDPFLEMIERQRRFASEVNAARHRKAPGPRPWRAPRRLRFLQDALAAGRVVLVHGEANAWARAHPSWQPAEIVHLVACRPSTGAAFESVVRPRRPLAPSTTRHLGLDEAALATGVPPELLRESWRSFVRPDDLYVAWGTFARDVARLDGVDLDPPVPAGEPARFFDLRTEIAQWFHRRASALEAMPSLAKDLAASTGRPRAWRRLDMLVQVINEIAQLSDSLPR